MIMFVFLAETMLISLIKLLAERRPDLPHLTHVTCVNYICIMLHHKEQGSENSEDTFSMENHKMFGTISCDQTEMMWQLWEVFIPRAAE